MPKKINPGEELFFWILNRYKRQRVSNDSWIHSISEEFNIPDKYWVPMIIAFGYFDKTKEKYAMQAYGVEKEDLDLGSLLAG